MKIDHEYTNELVCPHCGYQMSDSWEYNENWVHECEKCGGEFGLQRNMEVTYTTFKKPCEGEKHNYIFQYEQTLDKKLEKGFWVALPTDEHRTYKSYKCSVCDHEKIEKI